MFGWLSSKPHLSAEGKQKELDQIIEYVRGKLPELRKLKRKSKDKFGVYVEHKWEFQKRMFSNSSADNELKWMRGHGWTHIYALIDKIMEARQEISGSLSGHEYEFLVAAILRSHGWSVEQTAGSGDHGVDLVASNTGLRVAIQCKRFKGSVGTSAVQSVVGGSAFYQANKTAVVTTGIFTPAAIELAAVTRTALLEHDDLPRLNSMLL